MPHENPMFYVMSAVCILAAVAYGRKLYGRFFSSVKKEKATVVHKQTVENVSKYSGTGKRTAYAVTFSVNGKNRSFYVSEFSYNGYRKGETGTLTYKGDRLIDFH